VANAHAKAATSDDEWLGWGSRFLLIHSSSSPMTHEIVDILKKSPHLSVEMKNLLPTEIESNIPAPVNGAPPPSSTQFDIFPSLNLLGLSKYFTLEEMVDTSIGTMFENGFESTSKYDMVPK